MKRFIIPLLLLAGCVQPEKYEPKFELDYYKVSVRNDQGQVYKDIEFARHPNCDTLESIIYYGYNKKGLLNKETEIHFTHKYNITYAYTYDSSNFQTAQILINSKGDTTFQFRYEFDKKENCKISRQYKKKLIQQWHKVFLDSKKRQIRTISYYYDTNDTIIDSTFWINEFQSIEKNYSRKGIKTTYSEFYDKKGETWKQIRYNDSGKIEEILLWIRNHENKPFLTVFVDKNNEVKTVAVYKYNSRGQVMITEWYKPKTEK
ncbi:MAG: hypothetical protein V2A54_03190 [Bacteroidota bacterium]